MKTIKITSNHLGRFYFGDDSKQHSFSMSIFDGDNIANIDGTPCIIKFLAGEEDTNESILNSSDIENIMNNMYEIITLSLKYIKNVISTSDYEGQFLAFMKYYKQHFDEIDGNLLTRHYDQVNKEISRLQKQLSWDNIAPQPEDFLYENYSIIDHINSIKKTIKWYQDDLSELKPESKSYQDKISKIEKKHKELAKYEELINPNNI